MTLEQVPDPVMPSGAPIVVIRQPVLHSPAPIRLQGLDQGVDAIEPPAVSPHGLSAAVDMIPQPLGGPIIVFVVMKQLPAPVAAGNDMMDQHFVLQSGHILAKEG